MTKAELIKHIALQASSPWCHYTRRDCEKIIDTYIDIVTMALAEGEKIAIKDFMVLDVTEQGERRGRNPKTGEVVTYPATKRIHCRIAPKIKKAVNRKEEIL